MAGRHHERASRIYERAKACPAEARQAYLGSACGDDEELRREVEALLVSDEAAEPVPSGNAGDLKATAGGASSIGTYRLGRLLGEGGMGAVFQAYDTTLRRLVALKILHGGADDAGARARLLREARNAAALNHPNISTIYEVGEADGSAFIAMEYIEGRSLDQRLTEGALSSDEALRYGIEAANALAYAHENGVIHGDFKAANVIGTTDGRLKIVDFGLARRVDALAAGATTETSLAAGVVAGTPYAMSPEQIRGAVCDARSDIWALGVLLYESVTGARPFTAPTLPALFSAIVVDAPAPLPPTTPPVFAAVIDRCLEKDPERRYQTAGQVRSDLEGIAHGLSPASLSRRQSMRRPALVAGASIGVVFAASAAAWYLVSLPPTVPSPDTLKAVALTSSLGREAYPSLAPDGRFVAFTWNGPARDNFDIYVQMIDSGSPLRLTTDAHDDFSPAWSPDGRWIAFIRSANPPAQGALSTKEVRLVPPLGGPERKLTEIRVHDAYVHAPNPLLAWCPDSTCLVVTDSTGEGRPDALSVLSLETNTKRQLTTPRDSDVADTSPAFSRDGRLLVFRRLVTWLTGDLLVMPLTDRYSAAGEARSLDVARLNAETPAWVPETNDLLFAASGNLWRLAVGPGGATGAEPRRIPFVGEQGLMPALSAPQAGQAPRLVYVRNKSDSNIWRVGTTGPGGVGPELAIASTSNEMNPRFSPDGRRVVFQSQRSGGWELWTADVDGARALQQTALGAPRSGAPEWSPDGQWLAFNSNVEGQYDVYLVAASGGKPRNVTSHPANDEQPSFSRDGKWLYFSSDRTGSYEVWKLPVAGGDAVQLTHRGGFRAAESADGALLYYTDRSGATPATLWQIPTVGTAPPVRVVDGVIRNAFAPVATGIYYVDLPPGDAHARGITSQMARLEFLESRTGRRRTVARNLGELGSGLTVSPDGRTIFYARVDYEMDLMLVNGFR